MAGQNGQQAPEAMQLLSEPDQGDGTFSKSLKRGSCSYEDRSGRFRVKDRRYKQQYANLYFMRLMKMRKMVESAALNKWGRMTIYLYT